MHGLNCAAKIKVAHRQLIQHSHAAIRPTGTFLLSAAVVVVVVLTNAVVIGGVEFDTKKSWRV